VTPAGTVAVVTGGASGIGLAIARRLVEAGVSVSLWDIDEAALARVPFAADLRRVDVGDLASVEAAAGATEAALGSVSLVVANAGVLGPVAPLWEWPGEDFQRVLRVNLTGVFHTLKALVPRMLAQATPRSGRIVVMSSIQAKEGTAMGGAYGASKAALVGMTKTLGKELAGSGILANCITPSAVETDMATQITPERRADLTARIPMGRFMEPDEVAAMAFWLLSTECSFSTGAVFDISGGRATY
jgi:3-oxoacyl-[acyl-carrier protein] reductase